jgi:Tfp pilus assembly protein PilO
MSNIISIVLILASAGLFFGYIDPTYSSIKIARAEKAEYDRALNNSKELQAERDKLLDKYKMMPQEDIAKLEKLVPDNIDNVRLVIDIDEMARSHGMRIRNFQASTGAQKDTIGTDNTPYGVLTLTFSTSASYNTFLAFLRDLEQSLRIIDINSISFAASENQIYDYSVAIKTYWLK